MRRSDVAGTGDTQVADVPAGGSGADQVDDGDWAHPGVTFPEGFFDAVQQAHIRAFHQAAQDQQVRERRQVLHWAVFICRCTRWYDGRMPQDGCPVHSMVLISPDGRSWI
jgi:hypothetical protein